MRRRSEWRAISAGGVTVFPGWEFFSTIAGAIGTIFDLFPRCQVFVEEPAMVKNQLERWWNKVEQRHDRSGIGSLITPADVYFRPEILLATLDSKPGLDIDQLGAIDVLDEDTTLGEVAFASRPTLRFHGSIPALIEQLKTLMEQSVHMLLAVPNQGEVERLANLPSRIRPALPARQPRATRGQREHLRRIQLSRRRPAHAHHRPRTHRQRRQLPRLEPGALRRQRSH